MSSVTLRVPQGIGDIFWCYQKVAPYADRINFEIAYSGEKNDVTERSIDFLHDWPKTGDVRMVEVSPGKYRNLWQSTPESPVPVGNNGPYAVNAALESGIRLEDVHPGSEIEWGVQIRQEAVFVPDSYVCLYVSGNAKRNVGYEQWGVAEWYAFVLLFMERMPGRKLVIIGADFDKEMVDELVGEFGDRLATSFVGESSRKVAYILYNADFFIGYQSGLGILADNMGTPQLMMYFPHLEKMKYTWCQPGHKNQLFFADTFDRTPDQVLKDLSWGK